MDLHTDLQAPVYPQVLPHPPKLPESLREALHVRHYSNRTEDIGHVIRARKPIHLPVVLTREEVKALLALLTGDKWLMASTPAAMRRRTSHSWWTVSCRPTLLL